MKLAVSEDTTLVTQSNLIAICFVRKSISHV